LNWRVLLVFLIAALSIPIWRAATSRAKAQTSAPGPALPVVAVARVVREDLFNEVPISAEFRPFAEVELHAKVSGYVQEINVDFGDQVKAGQLLARLEVPELRNELDRSLAALQRAEADYHDAHLAYTRLLAVDQQNPNLVAQQELDAAEAKDHTTEAAIAGAKAEVEKNRTLLAYTRITAPFDGVITHRYADPGALIQSGTSSQTQSLPLVRISDTYRLRLDFPVSVCYVKEIQLGDAAEVRVESLGGKNFTGTISRFTHQVNDDTRTMVTEIEVANPSLELMPGMYATVVLKVHKRMRALTIPTEAVSSEERPTVYLIDGGGEIEERPVTLGLETSLRHEVIQGLKEGDLVMIGDRSEVHPGEKVEPKLIGTLARQ
jgi:RND family efflux transporter MFP subunit